LGAAIETAGLIVWGPDRLELGEGGRWVGDRMLLVDLLQGRLLEANPSRPGPLRQLVKLDIPLGAVAPDAGSADTWLAACGTGIARLHSDGKLEWLERPEDGKRVRMRMNDACADPAGRFWAGSMAYDFTPDAGSLYRVDHDGSVTQVLDGVTISNGPAFSADGATMYFADSARGTIDRFRVSASGDLLERQRFARLKTGVEHPDGMSVDAEDHLWVAVWGGSEARRYHPDGRVVQTVKVPALQASSVCLVGREDPRLFITSAAENQTDELAGALFVVPAEVTARPADFTKIG
jgi:sugar lactone lactonase YvrE